MVTTLGLNYVSFHYSLKVYTARKLILHQFIYLELGHALSDVHDSSSSRNDYVEVIMENITAEKNIQNHEFEHSYRISFLLYKALV